MEGGKGKKLTLRSEAANDEAGGFITQPECFVPTLISGRNL